MTEAERAAIWQHLIDNPPPRHPSHGDPKPITKSQRDFDRHYWHHVGPHLLKLIEGFAPMITMEVYTFSEAWEQIWKAAEDRGSMHMSEPELARLHDWIDHQLLARLDAPTPEGVITPERLRRITGER